MIRRHRERQSMLVPSLNVTAMCDVVFLLLIYLILTAKPPVPIVTLDASRRSAEGQVPPIPMVEITVLQDEYAICGKRVNAAGLGNTLHQLARIDDTQTVIVKCASDSEHRRLIETLNLCKEAGMSNVSVFSM